MAKTNVKRTDGCICDAPSKENGKKTAAYVHWNNMLKRALDENYKAQKPTYKDATVCEEWKTFSNFLKWFNSQTYKEGFELDKDILVQGNKIYSPETCCFLPRYINALLTQNKLNNTTGAVGVNYDKSIGNFKASCHDFESGIQKTLGRFKSLNEASEAYKHFKYKQIKLAAEYGINNNEISIEIYTALLNYKL